MGVSPGVSLSYDRGLAKTVLVVLAAPQLRRLLCSQLERCGVLSVSAASVAEAEQLLEEFFPDALLVDIDGDRRAFADLLTKLCDAPLSIPSAMLTSDVFNACGHQREICLADHCVQKPVHPGSLVQTVIGLLDGKKTQPVEAAIEGRIRRGLLSLDLKQRVVAVTVRGNEEIMDVAPRDFRLLSYLMEMPDTNHKRIDMLRKVWPEGGIDERTVDVSIMRLRKRLKALRLDGAIVTVPGMGYRFSTLFASTTGRAVTSRSSPP